MVAKGMPRLEERRGEPFDSVLFAADDPQQCAGGDDPPTDCGFGIPRRVCVSAAIQARTGPRGLGRILALI
jgi:hypothetical protein